MMLTSVCEVGGDMMEALTSMPTLCIDQHIMFPVLNLFMIFFLKWLANTVISYLHANDSKHHVYTCMWII